jgi:hypothetical protein
MTMASDDELPELTSMLEMHQYLPPRELRHPSPLQILYPLSFLLLR